MMEKLEIQKLISVVNKVMECDIKADNRLRENVDGRKMLSLLLKSDPYNISNKLIGEIIGMHRTTVNHYEREAKILVKLDSKFIESYDNIIDAIEKGADDFLNDNLYRGMYKKARKSLLEVSIALEQANEKIKEHNTMPNKNLIKFISSLKELDYTIQEKIKVKIQNVLN